MTSPISTELEPTTVIRARADVAVWDIGEGPPVLLVHGFPDHPTGLLDTAHRISEHGYRCVLPALPGYWPSGPVADCDYSSQAVGGDLLQVLDSLGIERTALIGHDWGAEIGYRLVSTHPQRFSHFVSLAVPHPSGYAVRHREFNEMRTAWYATYLAHVPGAAKIARDPRWLTALVHSWSPGLRWAAWEAVLDRLSREGVMEAVCSYYRSNLDETSSIAAIAVPTTIVHGGQDGCISPSAHPDFGSHFTRGVNQVFMPRVGHWPHLEDPDETVRLILAALAAT